jgi:hypothetical protein
MANITTPVLKITGSPTPGDSIVTVEYTVTFDAFDKASDMPYAETVRLIGDDTGTGDPAAAGPDDALLTMVPTFLFPSIVRASMVVAPATTLARTHTRTVSNAVLDEDKPPIPNPDETRAVVTLTPVFPSTVGPRESNQVSLTLP